MGFLFTTDDVESLCQWKTEKETEEWAPEMLAIERL